MRNRYKRKRKNGCVGMRERERREYMLKVMWECFEMKERKCYRKRERERIEK